MPKLDDEWEEINRTISESLRTGAFLMLTVFDPLQDYEFIGVVTDIDRQLKRLKLEQDGEITWLPIEDVLKARIAE